MTYSGLHLYLFLINESTYFKFESGYDSLSLYILFVVMEQES
jgi:hypothetical protein